MTVVAALLAVCCMLLAVVALKARASARTAAMSLDDQRSINARLEEEAERVTADVARLRRETDSVRAEANRVTEERLALSADVEELRATAARLTGDVSAMTGERDAAVDRAEAGESALTEVRTRLDEVEAELLATEEWDEGDLGGVLWGFELARSARTWRYSVSTDPFASNPLESTESPLQLAIEIEAAALREDVGARIAVVVDGEPSDAGTAVLVLRTAQEVMVSAAREAETASLTVTVRGRVADIVIDARDEDDKRIDVPMPEVAGRVAVIEGRLVISAT